MTTIASDLPRDNHDLASPRPRSSFLCWGAASFRLAERRGFFLIEPRRKGLLRVDPVDASQPASQPAGRPRRDDLLYAIDYWTKVGYPARGDT